MALSWLAEKCFFPCSHFTIVSLVTLNPRSCNCRVTSTCSNKKYFYRIKREKEKEAGSY